jgi:hypothetical protein
VRPTVPNVRPTTCTRIVPPTLLTAPPRRQDGDTAGRREPAAQPPRPRQPHQRHQPHTNNHQGLAAPPPADDGSWLAMRPHGARQGIFVRVPFGAVYSMPPGVTKWTFPSDIILCPAFKPADASSCPLGQRCAFVHADPMLVVPHTIHVNYAWRSLDDVTYERNAPGALLVVSSPNSSGPGDVMDSGMTLRTKALSSRRRPLSHCAHYYFNRTCNLGAECRFVHAVFIDLQAKEHQRTPAPVQLGRAAAAAGTLPPTPQQQPLHQPLSHRNHEFPPSTTARRRRRRRSRSGSTSRTVRNQSAARARRHLRPPAVSRVSSRERERERESEMHKTVSSEATSTCNCATLIQGRAFHTTTQTRLAFL